MAAKKKKKTVSYRFTQKRYDAAVQAEYKITHFLTEIQDEINGLLDEAEAELKKAGPAFEGHLYMLKKERGALDEALYDLDKVSEEVNTLINKLGPAGPGTAPKAGK